MDRPVTHPGPRALITTSEQVRESSGVTVENMPAGEDVGAGSVSAFIEAFRKHFGRTPSRFFEESVALPQAKKKPA